MIKTFFPEVCGLYARGVLIGEMGVVVPGGGGVVVGGGGGGGGGGVGEV